MIVVALCLLGLLPLGGGSAMSMIKKMDQAERDKRRKAYRIFFPADLSPEQVTMFLNGISGSMHRKTGLFNVMESTPSLAFEIWATTQGIEHWVKVPWQYEQVIVPPLLTLMPGTKLVPDDKPPSATWTQAVEVGIKNSHRQLRIADASALSANILTRFSHLDKGETLMMQWVISPATPEHKPVHGVAPTREFRWQSILSGSLQATKDEVYERRGKLEEHNFNAVLRIGAVASTKSGATNLIGNVISAVKSTHGAANHLVDRWWVRDIPRRIAHGASPELMRPQMVLSISELTALLGWRIGNPLVSGLPPTISRSLPAPESVPRDGRVLGVSTFPGRERRLAMDYTEALKHVYLSGGTGCLHPDTSIYDPVDDTTLTVKQRHELGRPFHVYAMHGTKLVVAPAFPPVAFQKVDMYRLYNAEHEILITGEHRVWNGRAYIEVDKLYRQQASAVVQLPSISDTDLSRLRASVLSCWQTDEDSQADHHPSLHSHDLLPLRASGSVLTFVPSRACDGAPCSDGCGKDAQAHTQAHTHHGLHAARSSRSSFSLLANHGHASVSRAAPYTYELPYRSHRSASESLSCSGRPDTIQRSGQSPLLSSSTCGNAPFNEYFKINTFRVEPASAETYYDFHVPELENYFACGLIHHNSGKTTAMANMIAQDMQAGYGVVVIENKGDLFHQALDYVPRNRLNDVVVLDVNDQSWPVGFNVLRQGNPAVAVDELNIIFNNLFQDRPSMWMQEILYHALHTLAQAKDGTFMDVYPLLMPKKDEEAWAAHLKASVHDAELKDFWQRFDADKKRDQKIEPLMSRLWPIMRSNLINIFGQAQSGFSMADIICGNKILLINLAGLEDMSARLAGTIFTNAVWQAAKANKMSRPNFLYIDEFQSFLKLPVDAEDMLAKSRSFGLGLVLANQHLAQLSDDMRDAIMSNAHTKIIFQTGDPRDASRLAASFGRMVTPEDFTTLGRYEALARIATETGTSAPLTLSTMPPMTPVGMGAKVRYASRSNYGRRADEVREDMDTKRTGYTPVKKRQPPKQNDWGI